MTRAFSMMLTFTLAVSLVSSAFACPENGTAHTDAGSIAITVVGMEAGQAIAKSQALCIPTIDGKSDQVKTALRPTIRWSGAPKETASFAIFMMDPDVPADFNDAGKEGKVLAKDMKRIDFFHYGLINIPAKTTELAGGDSSKPPAVGDELVNDLGLNKYVDPASAYGGPCPPWNDERLHHYHFIVLALDKGAPVNVLLEPIYNSPPTADPMTAKNTFNRLMESKHVLAHGTVVGTYTLNKALQEKAKPAS